MSRIISFLRALCLTKRPRHKYYFANQPMQCLSSNKTENEWTVTNDSIYMCIRVFVYSSLHAKTSGSLPSCDEEPIAPHHHAVFLVIANLDFKFRNFHKSQVARNYYPQNWWRRSHYQQKPQHRDIPRDDRQIWSISGHAPLLFRKNDANMQMLRTHQVLAVHASGRHKTTIASMRDLAKGSNIKTFIFH